MPFTPPATSELIFLKAPPVTCFVTHFSAAFPPILATPSIAPLNGLEFVIDIINPFVSDSKLPSKVISAVVIDSGINCKLPVIKSGS